VQTNLHQMRVLLFTLLLAASVPWQLLASADASAAAALGDGGGVVTQMTRCIGPLNVPPAGSLPKLCASMRFAECGSDAIDVSVTSDDSPLYAAQLADLTKLRVDYPMAPGCVARLRLDPTAEEVITPVYVHVHPEVAVICAGYVVSTKKLADITLGAACSALNCSSCTASESCGWCSDEPDFADKHDTDDLELWKRLSTHGRCVARGDNNAPYCSSCALTFALDNVACPVYTDASPASGGGGSSSPSSGGGLGRGAERAVIVVVVLLVTLAGGCAGFYYWQRRQRKRHLSALEAAYHQPAEQLELKTPRADGSINPMSVPLTQEVHSSSSYIPPSVL